MAAAAIISKTDVARRTREILEQAKRGKTMIVESYGEEQAAILSVLDYRILRAVAAYQALPPHAASISDSSLAPRGLDLEEIEKAVAAADGDVQGAWNCVIGAYLDADISLGRAADLLGLSRFELADHFQRIGLPLRTGPATVEEAREEFTAF